MKLSSTFGGLARLILGRFILICALPRPCFGRRSRRWHSRISCHCYETEFCDTQALDFLGAIFRLKTYPLLDGEPG